jgi:hypothetical protein
MDQYVLLYPEQVNICESSSLCDPNQGIFADNGYSPAGGPFLTEEFTDLYPASNVTSSFNPHPPKKYPKTAAQKEANKLNQKRKREELMMRLCENETLEADKKAKEGIIKAQAEVSYVKAATCQAEYRWECQSKSSRKKMN